MSRHAGPAEGIEPRREDGDLDAVAGRVMAELLERSHLMRPAEVSSALTQAALPLGVSAARIYLADLQQRQLAVLPAGEGQGLDALPIDSTLAGRAYQTVTIQSAPVHGTNGAGGNYQVWVPLVDGTERLGVLGLTVADVSQAMLDRYRTLASLAGIMVMAKLATATRMRRSSGSRRWRCKRS